MTRSDPEIEELREKVHCAVVLERQSPPWRIDPAESMKHCLKYRRGKGEVLIVNHEGRGWWDPRSDAKGDVFDLVQHFDPSLNFGHVRKTLREFIGLSPSFPEAKRRREKDLPDRLPADRWAARPRFAQDSPSWPYLTQKRGLPLQILDIANAADVLRPGPYGSAWFAHRDDAGRVTHVEIRGPAYKGSLRGGTKVLFRFSRGSGHPTRFALAEAPIDALSLAALEGLRQDTLYAATGGGMGPATIEAIEAILAGMAKTPGALFCSAADANPAGERYALRHQDLAARAGVAFARLAPPIVQGDWNDILVREQQAQLRRTT
ncbi:DUF3991 and TOPRIM domain-containing protein (plasmid) [Methylocapsa polymorpha]|uniref:DUF3991 and TOPRIM domain-containing protein n=1 Tax=Methylocapsa polymorpha TaxID=3080828 RepID=A0ABZ0HYN6_9HYPH|nr:DUF3991 and TOPRIM domain-containing protein [Methylocapsa sp. RX1]WOJ91694.1 DUF3991 and TOPRIM domain-containing protein [Methylocapsa sp. RX1]